MEAILSNSTRKRLWFEIRKLVIALYGSKFIASFIIVFGTLSFPIDKSKYLTSFTCQSNSSQGVATDHCQSRSRKMADFPSYY